MKGVAILLITLCIISFFTAEARAIEVEWENTYGGSNSDFGWSVQQTTDGGFISVGHVYSSDTRDDIYLVKTDSTGTLQWEKTYGTDDYDYGRSVQQTSDGGYIITGSIDSDICLVKTANSSHN